MWQFYEAGRQPVNNPLLPWKEAIKQPGALQMQHGRHLIESRPFLTRIPDDSIIVPSQVPTAMPGAGTRRFVATRDEAGTYAMIYAPVSKPFTVRLDKITGPKVQAWWFDPRSGTASKAGEFPNTGTQTFTPASPGEATDWVLVLDDAAKGYPPPGQSK
jgi:hypothetical protein